MTRFFTQSQRRELYVLANGECQGCGCELGPGWHAHHIKPWSQGGVTEIDNAEALCERCHLWRHNGMELRKWQQQALNEFERTDKAMLIEASVGAGKTHCVASMAKSALMRSKADLVVVVVPSRVLKRNVHDTFLLHGLQVMTHGYESATPPGRAYQAVAMTYQKLPQMLATIEVWRSRGRRLLTVIDEVHHASDANRWGADVERLVSMSERVVFLTGTPFRSDGRRIPCLEYDAEGRARADVKYPYAQAVYDGVCRPVMFETQDSMARYIAEEDEEEVRLSEATEDRAYRALASALTGEFLPGVVDRMVERLDELRLQQPDAAALIVVPPGRNEAEDRRVEHVAALVERRTGEKPTVVHHHEKNSNALIERFRKGSGRFLVAVNMVSEGVDIPRLRVLMLARRVTSEMLFRQLAGRVVRTGKGHPDGASYVLMPSMEPMTTFAARVEAEAESALRERKEQASAQDAEAEERQQQFIPLGGTHEVGAVIGRGGTYTAELYAKARHAAQAYPGIRFEDVLGILAAAESVPQESEAPVVSKEQELERLSEEVNKRICQVAKRDGRPHAYVWNDMYSEVGGGSLKQWRRDGDTLSLKRALGWAEARLELL